MSLTFSQISAASLAELPQVLESAEGFADLLAGLRRGESGVICGAWGSSAALAAAAVARRIDGSLLLLLAHEADVDPWVEDLASFYGARPMVFPAASGTVGDAAGFDEVAGQRLRVLKALVRQPPRLIVATISAIMQPVPDTEELARQVRQLQVGDELPPDELIEWLLGGGMVRRETVELPGEFSRRGGILDVFPIDADAPARIEFFGDRIETIRLFSPETQRSQAEITGFEITVSTDSLPPNACLAEYLAAGSCVGLVEPNELHEQGKHYLQRAPDIRGLFSVEAVFRHVMRRPVVSITSMPHGSADHVCPLRVESIERFSGKVEQVRNELKRAAAADRVIVACHNEAEQKRLADVLAGQAGAAGSQTPAAVESPIAEALPVLLIGQVRAGFRLADAGVVVVGDHELFRRELLPARKPPARLHEARAIDSFLDLAENDLVVHVSHGFARFRGMTMLQDKGSAEEHLVLEFAEGTRLYVPSSKIDLVQKYVGGPHAAPELSRLGTTAWQRRKERVERAVLDLAAEMIDLQAVRASRPGAALPHDGEWQAEFEASFPYQETPDQLAALAEIKADMQRPRPMDRLICGDVGFGKTELAVRAAFKMMDCGKQVAVLVPTTVLAEQHLRTFAGRLAEYPFVVECLSRFRSAAEQKSIVRRLAEGAIDLVIGTHRLLSQDVSFKDLGLVIIDEEQRFGVDHKERLKKLRATVDVLTMTATPIPRTLHLSLLGIRDISNLETPPRDRLAVETRLVRFDPTLVRQAILRELNRDGQVFFVHNRVYNIHEIAERIRTLVPEARIDVAHGQMPEGELEEAMLRFVRRQSDVLVATTIIESGLDIPNANTIFIHEADRYGLADLHQLRGRVGRYKHRAYCYLLLDGARHVTPQAYRRLKAIEEFTELGAGFKIAMRDLEIRGAGNILGTQQSGHIAAVGYELYCQLLENAIRALRHEQIRTSLDVAIDLPWPAFFPREYIASQRGKIENYRRLARLRGLEQVADFREELLDRFGPPPPPVDWLLRLQELRILAARHAVADIHLENQDMVFGYRSRGKIEKLAQHSRGRLKVVDDQTAYLRLRPPESDPGNLYRLLKALLQSPV